MKWRKVVHAQILAASVLALAALSASPQPPQKDGVSPEVAGRTAFRLPIPLGLDLYMPVPEGNPLSAEKIALGRRLFFDPVLSRDGTLACATCHDPARAFTDGRTTSVGVFSRKGTRNVPALINRGYGAAFFWDGRTSTLEEQVLRPIQDPNEMDLSLAEVVAPLDGAERGRPGPRAGELRALGPLGQFSDGPLR